MQPVKTLRVLVMREDGMFVAQCLEHDICTQAPTIEILQERMDCLIQIELDASPTLDQAPERFHKMWEMAFYKSAGELEYGLMPAAA